MPGSGPFFSPEQIVLQHASPRYFQTAEIKQNDTSFLISDSSISALCLN